MKLSLKLFSGKFWSIALASVLIMVAAFAFYIWHLFGQLEHAFALQEQFIPTRIYSDVSRVALAQTREPIEAKLKALGYTVDRQESSLSFTLHPIDYPPYLLPAGHLTLDSAGKPVKLHFDGSSKGSVLQSIQVGPNEATDIYLEPELAATLSRGGSATSREIRSLIKFQDIPALVWKALIGVEDQHYLEHKGLDPRGLVRMVWVDLRTRSLAQGGSTITAQLVKNLMARRGKNVFRKFSELFLALLLEVKYDKEQILERYLNEVYLGQVGSFEVHGVAEGAEHFFGKKLEELSLNEIAFMVGLMRGPYYYSPYRHLDRALERQRYVLKRMVETGQIAEAEAQAAVKQPVHLAPFQSSGSKAPYFTDFVKAELIRQLTEKSKDKLNETDVTSSGFRVYTTLDLGLSAIAQHAVNQGIGDLEKRLKIPPTSRLEGALASVDQATGNVKVLIGGRSYAQSTFNRILNMKRQVGSTFKPLVYLAAYQKGDDAKGVPYSPGHPAEDAPWKLIYDHGRQTWSPRNYEPEHMGWISFRTALAHSVNTVAAKLGTELGYDLIIQTARKLGIESDLPSVPSLPLGVAELSPLELLRAYAAIANHGLQQDLVVIRGISQANGSGYSRPTPGSRQAVDPGAADLLTDTMISVFTEGTAVAARSMGFEQAASGKTGTTSHHRDAWFAGFTPQLTTVVWVGADQDSGKKSPGRLTGANSALPVWVSYMKSALAGEPPALFQLEAHLTAVKIDKHSGKAASAFCSDSQTQMEKFITGHEPKQTACESGWPPSAPVATQ